MYNEVIDNIPIFVGNQADAPHRVWQTKQSIQGDFKALSSFQIYSMSPMLLCNELQFFLREKWAEIPKFYIVYWL